MTQFSIPNSDSIGSVSFEKIVTIDISDFTGSEDYIGLSLPEFPSAKLELGKTFIDFTSNPKGDFGIGPVDQIAFNQAGVTIATTSGNSEMKIPIALLTTVDKTMITGVRFRIAAAELCTFRCLSIRAFSADWVYAPTDLDTLWGRVHRPPSTNGSATQSSAFPEATNAPKAWPIVFRANPLTGLSDPKPVNLSVGVTFTSGSFAQATSSSTNFNEFALYFRDVPTDNQTMVELNSMIQSQLDAHGDQPDFGKALYDSRDQEELDIEDQEELDEQTQFNIERIPDESEHTWLEVKLKWGKTQASNKLTIHDADGVGYEFTNMPIEASKHIELDKGNFTMIVDLEDSRIRCRIYKVNQVEEIGSLVFDSGTVFDDTLIKRRKGRFGWWTSLLDGDAYIHSVKSRGTNFGEIVTKEFQSITPVKGVSLYAGSTEDHQLVSGIEPTDRKNMTVTLDPSASGTGKAFKITTAPLRPLQGIATNPFLIDDPRNFQMSFDIKFPSSQVPEGGLTIFLLGEYEDIIPVTLSPFTKDTWTHVKVSLTNELFQTGNYQLVIMQTLPVIATTWWIENVSVKTYSVKWSARPQKDDAWNLEGDRWQDAGFTLNSLNGGIVFEEPGNGLQVRAQALRQDAVINDFKAIPQYATLGRFAWEDESVPITKPTITEITHTGTTTATFTAAGVSSDVIRIYWDFGDGESAIGSPVTHTYASTTTVPVICTVINAQGGINSAQISYTP